MGQGSGYISWDMGHKDSESQKLGKARAKLCLLDIIAWLHLGLTAVVVPCIGPAQDQASRHFSKDRREGHPSSHF